MEDMIPDVMTEADIDLLVSKLVHAGVSECGTPVPINDISVYFSNITVQSEVDSILAAEEFQGHHWIQRVKCEILSRAVTRLNSTTLTDDTTTTTQTIRAALRDTFLTWAPEFLQVVWRIYMVHCQNIEDQLMANFPESATTTDYERRFFEQSLKVIEDVAKELKEESLE